MGKASIKPNSTQKFIEIQDIFDDVVVLPGGNACMVIKVEATNFDLLSEQEQNAKIYAYSALLNSLSFSIQIVVRSKLLNISSYLDALTEEARKTLNPNFSQHIQMYRNFVAELIKVNSVLDKNFYIVVPYSSLEKGVFGAKQVAGLSALEEFSKQAGPVLRSKAETVRNQLGRIGLKSEILDRNKLIKLYYDIFNEMSLTPKHETEGKAIVKGKEVK